MFFHQKYIALFKLVTLLFVLQSNPLQVSFHLPLHRYFAVFLSQAVQTFNVSLDEVLPPADVMQMLMTHPLQLQVIECSILVLHVILHLLFTQNTIYYLLPTQTLLYLPTY